MSESHTENIKSVLTLLDNILLKTAAKEKCAKEAAGHNGKAKEELTVKNLSTLRGEMCKKDRAQPTIKKVKFHEKEKVPKNDTSKYEELAKFLKEVEKIGNPHAEPKHSDAKKAEGHAKLISFLNHVCKNKADVKETELYQDVLKSKIPKNPAVKHKSLLSLLEDAVKQNRGINDVRKKIRCQSSRKHAEDDQKYHFIAERDENTTVLFKKDITASKKDQKATKQLRYFSKLQKRNERSHEFLHEYIRRLEEPSAVELCREHLSNKRASVAQLLDKKGNTMLKKLPDMTNCTSIPGFMKPEIIELTDGIDGVSWVLL